MKGRYIGAIVGFFLLVILIIAVRVMPEIEINGRYWWDNWLMMSTVVFVNKIVVTYPGIIGRILAFLLPFVFFVLMGFLIGLAIEKWRSRNSGYNG